MKTVDDNLLASYGIVLTDEEKPEFYKQLGERLEELVGFAIIEKLDDDKAKELMDLSNEAEDEVVASWLQQNVPDYEDIANEELDTILREVAEAQAEQK
jgi:hypothetical protein